MTLDPALSQYYSTNLNSRIVSYDELANRVLRQLGAPIIKLEIHCDQIYDFISEAIEMFTKYAGYTEEYLIFDSELYVPGVGIKVDSLINSTPETSKPLPENPDLSAGYDYDLESFRRVIDVFSFEEGTSTGVNTLFTLEQAMAQQTYFAYALGNYGFDLVTWHSLKEWIDNREKLLASKTYFRFDSRTQLLKLFPEPRPEYSQYLGLVGCYIERPIKDLVKEKWILKYVLALSKIAIANIRGYIGGTTLMGGGTINATDLMTQGVSEKEYLEKQLMEGYGPDTQPIKFFVG